MDVVTDIYSANAVERESGDNSSKITSWGDLSDEELDAFKLPCDDGDLQTNKLLEEILRQRKGLPFFFELPPEMKGKSTSYEMEALQKPVLINGACVGNCINSSYDAPLTTGWKKEKDNDNIISAAQQVNFHNPSSSLEPRSSQHKPRGFTETVLVIRRGPVYKSPIPVKFSKKQVQFDLWGDTRNRIIKEEAEATVKKLHSSGKHQLADIVEIHVREQLLILEKMFDLKELYNKKLNRLVSFLGHYRYY